MLININWISLLMFMISGELKKSDFAHNYVNDLEELNPLVFILL